MKIAFVAVKGLPYGGGIEHVTEEIGSRMVKRGHEVVVYCSSRYCSDNGHYKGMRRKSLPSMKHPYLEKISLCLNAVLDLLFYEGADIVHLHSVASLFAGILRVRRVGTVAHIHSLEWKKRKWNALVRFFLKLTEYVAARLADDVIVVSENLRDYFYEKYKKETLLLPSGVDSANYRPPLLIENFGLLKNDYILYIGRLSREKGVDYLLDAFSNVVTDKKLVIAGDYSDTSGYNDALKKRIDGEENVIHVGYVRGGMKAELLSNAYVAVFPGEVEGSPVALIEAMSYGNCCLVSNISENLSVLNGNGYSFENTSVEDLKISLRYLLSHKNAVDRHKENAREYVLRCFNWEEILSLYERTCLSLLAR